MPRTRLSAALYLALVFASGILVGVVSHRLYVTSTVSATAIPPRTQDDVRKRYDAAIRSFGANEQQIDAVNRILDDTKRKYDDLNAREKTMHDQIHQDMVDQVSALLTPQQKTAYDAWRAERARLHAQQQNNAQQNTKK